MNATQVTRARAKRADREPRVHRVARMMCAGEWHTGPSHAALAAEWKCSIKNVEDIARQASALVRYIIGADAEDLRARLVASLEDIRRRAIERVEYGKDGGAYPSPDLRAATQTIATQAALLGLTQQAAAQVAVQVNAQQSGAPRFESAREAIDYVEGVVLPRLRARAAIETHTITEGSQVNQPSE